MELFEQIRREYEHGVGTINGVAKKLGMHRRLVREALRDAMPRERKVALRERPKLAGGGRVHRRDPGGGSEGAAEAAAHGASYLVSAARELAEVTVAESTVRRVRAGAEDGAGAAAAGDVRSAVATGLGREGQVDWYEAWAEIEGERQKV